MAELGFFEISGSRLGTLRSMYSALMYPVSRYPHFYPSAQVPEPKGPPRSFAGTMPIAFSRRHLSIVQNPSNDYVLLEKSDGVRYMLMTDGDSCFLIDRKCTFYICNGLQFPRWDDGKQMQSGTLLDGEIVFNIETKDPEYLVYDILALAEDTTVASRPVRERRKICERFVLAPREAVNGKNGSFRVRFKDFYEKHEIGLLFSRISKNEHGEYIYCNRQRPDGADLVNQNDGVIFQPATPAYEPKKCEIMFKWKYPNKNSVDFQLKLGTDDKVSGGIATYLWYRVTGDENGLYRRVYFPSALRAEFAAKEMDGAIIECTYDREAGEWRYLKRRTDKDSPNFAAVVIETLESIAENLARDELIKRLTPRAPGPAPGPSSGVSNRHPAPQHPQHPHPQQQHPQHHPQQHPHPQQQQQQQQQQRAPAPQPSIPISLPPYRFSAREGQVYPPEARMSPFSDPFIASQLVHTAEAVGAPSTVEYFDMYPRPQIPLPPSAPASSISDASHNPYDLSPYGMHAAAASSSSSSGSEFDPYASSASDPYNPYGAAASSGYPGYEQQHHQQPDGPPDAVENGGGVGGRKRARHEQSLPEEEESYEIAE